MTAMHFKIILKCANILKSTCTTESREVSQCDFKFSVIRAFLKIMFNKQLFIAFVFHVDFGVMLVMCCVCGRYFESFFVPDLKMKELR